MEFWLRYDFILARWCRRKILKKPARPALSGPAEGSPSGEDLKFSTSTGANPKYGEHLRDQQDQPVTLKIANDVSPNSSIYSSRGVTSKYIPQEGVNS